MRGWVLPTKWPVNLALVSGVLIGLIIAGLVLTGANLVGAVGAKNTLKVSPIRTDIEVRAGQSKALPVTVTNITNSEMMVRSAVNDFVAGDEDGTPALILDEASFAPKRSLKRFVEPVGSFELAAGEAKTISVKINVPEQAQPGGYFGAVRFMPASPEDGGQVNLSPSVASLILLKVPGDVTEKLDLTDFAVKRRGVNRDIFIKPDDIEATIRLASDSDVQLGPFGKVSVKKGQRVVYETDFNGSSPRDMVLPDSARRWSVALGGIEGFGRYTASAVIAYGKDNQTIEVEKSFWVIPVAMVAAVLGAILAAIGLIVIVMLKNRQLRRRVGFGR